MDYGTIRTQFQSILNRSDCNDALADTFLNQAMLRASRDCKITAQEKFEDLTVDGSYEGFPVPEDMRQVILFRTTTSGSKPMTHKTLRKFYELDDMVGEPQYFCRVQDFYQFKPEPSEDTEIHLHYYGSFEEFANDNDETELSILSPDLIIYGGLSYAADHFIDERADRWESRYQQILESVQTNSQTEDGETEVQPAYSLDGDT